MSPPYVPPLPPGREVHLPGRGATFVRELPGPGGGAPTVLLLHGWTATADLNWFPSFPVLGRGYRVLALDQRGHGGGIRSRQRFRMRDCADDAAALLDVVGVDRVVAVGYSMGGAVAQLLWRRHPDRVAGLVLCATSRNFGGRPQERMGFAVLAGLALGARAVPGPVRRRVAGRLITGRTPESTIQGWVLAEMGRHDWRTVLEAGTAIGRFDSRPWIGEVDVPTAVVATVHDNVVHPKRQLALHRSIPGATLHPVQGDHTVCVADPRRFVPALLDACHSVTTRLAGGGRDAPRPAAG